MMNLSHIRTHLIIRFLIQVGLTRVCQIKISQINQLAIGQQVLQEARKQDLKMLLVII